MPKSQTGVEPKKSKSQRNKEERDRRIQRNGIEHERQRSNASRKKSYVPAAKLTATELAYRREKHRLYIQERRRKLREEKTRANEVRD